MMHMLKKNAVWIVLLMTLAACFYVSQQDGDMQSDSLNKPHDMIDLTHKTPGKVNNKTYLFNQKKDSNHFLRPELAGEPKNIFTVFIPKNQINTTEKPVEAAPANPFVFAGKLVEDGKIIVFLMDAQKNYSVVSGDMLADDWQVRSIVPPLMTIRYLPLKIDMQLQIGALS